MKRLYLSGLSLGIMLLFSSCLEEPARKKGSDTGDINSKEILQQISYRVRDSATVDSILLLAEVLFKKGELDSAKAFYFYTLPWVSNDTGKVKSYHKLGNIYMQESNYDSAIYFLNKGRIVLEKSRIKKTNGLDASIYVTIGTAYYRRMQLDSAAIWFYKGLAALNTQENTASRYAFAVYSAIGAFWNNIGKIDLGRSYLSKAEEVAIQLNDTALLLEAQNRKASFYFQKGSLDSAIHIYEKILQNQKMLVSTQLDAYYNLGTIYALERNKNQPEKAIPYFKKALDILDSNKKQQYQKTGFLFALASAYLNTGIQKNDPDYYQKAKQVFSIVDTFKSNTELTGNLKHFYGNYAYSLYKLEEYKKSAEIFMRAVMIRDSLFTHEILARINESEFQYRSAEKDKLLAQNQLQIAQQENKIQKQYLWIGGIIGTALISVLMLIGLLHRKRHRTEMARLKDIMTGEEKERIRLARELHDGIVSQLSAVKMGFSTLPVQYEDMNEATNDFQFAVQQLEQSISELRTISHNMLPDLLEQAGLTTAVAHYCQKISNIAGFPVQFLLAGTLPSLKQEFQLTIYRIVQELLQNIIKHANATAVLVQFTADHKNLFITIEDNGSGIHFFTNKMDNNGIGLHNIKERLATVNGEMDIEAEAGEGTTVYLSFDLNNMQRE